MARRRRVQQRGARPGRPSRGAARVGDAGRPAVRGFRPPSGGRRARLGRSGVCGSVARNRGRHADGRAGRRHARVDAAGGPEPNRRRRRLLARVASRRMLVGRARAAGRDGPSSFSATRVRRLRSHLGVPAAPPARRSVSRRGAVPVRRGVAVPRRVGGGGRAALRAVRRRRGHGRVRARHSSYSAAGCAHARMGAWRRASVGTVVRAAAGVRGHLGRLVTGPARRARGGRRAAARRRVRPRPHLGNAGRVGI
mmetsp:Transcript_16407/g.50954  ORF Transcript_16407/g.50954 Transcript_16407/m.50954 type:complete len:253 (+) Transcript_16407:347-1105(+)